MSKYIIPPNTQVYYRDYPSVNGEYHYGKIMYSESYSDGLYYSIYSYTLKEDRWIHEDRINYDHRKSKLKFI